jgi:5-methylcytosine-specific restriction endonuclease McrA
MDRYHKSRKVKSDKPSVKSSQTRVFDRDPLVVAIARKRAGNACEVDGCQHPLFPGTDNLPYTEVHHLVMLSDGGEDTLENVVNLCPSHHREIHLGKNSKELTIHLFQKRTITKNQ